jgi:hypothetical protein
MLKSERFQIARIYVPARHRGRLNPEVVREIAESILEIGQQTPIQVRPDGDRFVLVEGLHRLEARRALGEETVAGLRVQARAPDAPHSPSEADAVRLKTERLKQLRLAKEAAEESPLRSVEVAGTKAATRPVHAFGRSKNTSLVDWLGERDSDGFRS